MRILARPDGAPLVRDRLYLVHGEGRETLAVLATQRMLRFIALAGYPPPSVFRMSARAFDMHGAELAHASWNSPTGREIVFDSKRLLGERPAEGSVLLELDAVEFSADFSPALPLPQCDLNGFLIVHDAGRFVTGVHFYHSVENRSPGFLIKHYAKQWIKRIFYALADGGVAWPREAVGASVARSSPGGQGFLVMHSDNPAPMPPSILEYRSQLGGIARRGLPALGRNGTLKMDVSPKGGAAEEWGQVLCALPPFGISRFLTGERFADGRLCFDHNYFQQLRDSQDKVRHEIRWFHKSLLTDGVIGPSHPWPCLHGDGVESLVAMCNQFQPSEAHVYDIRIFDNDGRLVVEKIAAIRLEPYGLAVHNFSENLRREGIRKFEGTYLVTHSACDGADRFPSRIHAQGVYRFSGGYWNAAQSDASIWASPNPPVPEIEALSLARVRRPQYWLAPVVETDALESVIAVSNLSYSLKYDRPITLGLRYAEGDRILAEREVTLKPFGAALLSVRELFGDAMTQQAGGVTIYPKTGITYCASVLIRDRRSKIFFLEHVLSLAKFPHEIAA